MSRDWNFYELECRNCGNKGKLNMWSDDWNRWGTTDLEGFSGIIRVLGPQHSQLNCKVCGTMSPTYKEVSHRT